MASNETAQDSPQVSIGSKLYSGTLADRHSQLHCEIHEAQNRKGTENGTEDHCLIGSLDSIV